MFNKIYQLIEENNPIIIHRHTNPDGDAMGSQIGLKEAILATFPNKEVYVIGDYSERYHFIGELDIIDDSKYNDALVFVLDSGAEHLINDERYKKGKVLIKIDHHMSDSNYGDYNYVDTSRESCAGVICDLIENTNLVLNEKSARALFTGLVTDSGRFRYSSTTSKSFENAAYLLKQPFDIQEIYKNLYVEELSTVKLKASLISKFCITEKNVAYLINTKEEVLSYGLDTFSVSRGMVSVMSGIKGIEVWANFTEDVDGKICVEFRSSSKNVNKVAVKYGGGGHLLASGCMLDDFDQIQEVLNDLNLLMEEEDV